MESNKLFAHKNGNSYKKDLRGNRNQRDNKTNESKSICRDNHSVSNMERDSQAKDCGKHSINNFNQPRNKSGQQSSFGGGGRCKGSRRLHFP